MSKLIALLYVVLALAGIDPGDAVPLQRLAQGDAPAPRCHQLPGLDRLVLCVDPCAGGDCRPAPVAAPATAGGAAAAIE